LGEALASPMLISSIIMTLTVGPYTLGMVRALRANDMIQKIGIMRRKYISIFDIVEQQRRLIEEYNPQAIKGYSSSRALVVGEKKGVKVDKFLPLVGQRRGWV